MSNLIPMAENRSVLLTVSNSKNASKTTESPIVNEEHMENCICYGNNDVAAAAVDAVPNDLNFKDTEIIRKSILHQFHVHLEQKLAKDEQLGLIGDAKILGEWKLERAITLRLITNTKWSANILLPNCLPVKYRYFIYAVDKNGQKHIRRWETIFHPRTIIPNGVANHNDIFGKVHKNDERQIKRGWLTNETILQFKFDYEQIFQVLDIEKFDPENIYIKIIPIIEGLHKTKLYDDVLADLHIETVKFNYGDSLLQTQQAFGVSYKRGDIIIFHITVPNPLSLSFAILFYTQEHEVIGRTMINAQQLLGSEGLLELKINTEDEMTSPIARLSLPYLIIRAMPEQTFDFCTTQAYYWPKSWPTLYIGHRGNGCSFIANPPKERENTLASYQSAYKSYADMIELDVHVTSDGIPIIYHDFGVKTAPQSKLITSADQLAYVLIKDLSYETLKNLRIFAVINEEPVEFPSHNNESRSEHRIFPTLLEVLHDLPKSLGVNVEIKWPQFEEYGAAEAEQTIDKNYYIDRILSTAINIGCDRLLIFSSFDADVCTMLRFKQNLFPVIFLTMGATTKWNKYRDLRTRSFENALNNAQAFELAGTAPHAEDFLSNNGAQLMQMAHNLEQITIIWGNDCNSMENIKYFKEIGATAICFDRSDLYMPDDKERACLNSITLLASKYA